MNDLAIRVEGLGKRYTIVPPEERSNTLRDEVAQWARNALQAVPTMLRNRKDDERPENTLWALRNVSFEVGRGEVVGIIGPNGAGKSTILKILSRITEPTTGEVEIRGRVGSLLEVGTGFHSELTGRENIYLNGAILGMGRQEIDRKFDEMVAFAEVERFIDTPVKHYSSGMYLRLAFAVAAHLEPEILVVDEVLAVGDAEFQKKCLGKMQSVAGHGRTVLFVSHDMTAIRRLCPRALLIKNGEVAADGPTDEVAAHYFASISGTGSAAQWIDTTASRRSGSQEARFVGVTFTSGNEAVAMQPYTGGPLVVTMAIEAERRRQIRSLAATIYDPNGAKLVNADTIKLGESIILQPGRNIVRLSIDALHLLPGVYTLGLWLGDGTGGAVDFIESATYFEIVDAATDRKGARPQSDGIIPCSFTVDTETATRK